MIVELQLDADTFLASFREQMRKALACELTEDEFDLDSADGVPGEPYIVVGYEVGKTTLRRANNATQACLHPGDLKTVMFRPVRKPEVVQELAIHISWVKDIRAANTHKAATVPFQLDLVFQLSMDCANPQVLCFSYVGLENLPADDPLAQKLAGKIHGTCVWLPIDRVIGAYMPKDMKLINGHLSMSESKKCLAVRLEFWDLKWGVDTGDWYRDAAYWDFFYGNGVIDRLDQPGGRAGWNLFLDHHAILGFVKQEVLNSVKGEKGVTVTRQPKAEWFDYVQVGAAKLPGYARIHVDLEVEKENACYCFTEDLDVAAEITADVYITVPKQDVVRIDLYTDVSPDFWDATCCVLTAAAFWPILGFGQMATGKVTSWEYLAGFLPFVSFIAAIVKVSDQHFDAKGKWIKDPDDEDHAFSEDHLFLPADPNLGQLALLGSKPLSDGTSLQAFGLFLWGSLQVFSPPQPVLEDPELEPFCWDKAGRCSKRIAASSRFRLYPKNPQHWALLRLCEARVLDDPYQMYKLEVHKEQHGFYDLVVRVDFWSMKPEFWQPGKSYPCRILIKTTGGVRIVTLEPLSALSQEQFQALAKQAAFEYVNECYLPRHRLFEELEWPIEQLIEQPGLIYTQVRAIGLDPGERVDLIGPEGQEMGRFTVDRQGTLLVTTLANQPAVEGAGMSVLRLRRTAGGRAGLPGRMKTLSHHPAPPPLGPLSTDPNLRPEVLEVHAANDSHGMLSKVCPPDALGRPADILRLLDDMISIQAKAMEGLERHDRHDREVILRQTLLEERGVLRLPSEARALTGSGDRLFAVMETLVEGYDISDARAPRLAESWRGEGIRGAVLFGGRLLLWGEPGIWAAGDALPARPLFARCDSDGVRGAAVAGDRLFVLRRDEVQVYDAGLCEVARHDAPGAEEIVALGSRLFLRDAKGIRNLDSDRAGGCGCDALGPIERLETPPFPLGGRTLYAHGPEVGLLLKVRDGTPEVVAEYPGGAWFAGLVRAGRYLCYVADGNVVRLLEPVRTVMSE